MNTKIIADNKTTERDNYYLDEIIAAMNMGKNAAAETDKEKLAKQLLLITGEQRKDIFGAIKDMEYLKAPEAPEFIEGDEKNASMISIYNILENLNKAKDPVKKINELGEKFGILGYKTEIVRSNVVKPEKSLEDTSTPPLNKEELKAIAISLLKMPFADRLLRGVTQDLIHLNRQLQHSNIDWYYYSTGRLALIMDLDKKKKMWVFDEVSWKLINNGFKTPELCEPPRFTSDSKFVVFEGNNGKGNVYMFDLQTGEMVTSFNKITGLDLDAGLWDRVIGKIMKRIIR